MDKKIKKIKSLFDVILDFLFPPKCSFCGELLEDKTCLCPKCHKKYSDECSERCEKCGGNPGSCRCSSRGGLVPDVYITFYRGYDERGDRVTETLMYRLKREYDISLMDFFSRDAAAHIMRYMVSHGESTEDYVITYSPRSDANLRKYGFDHSEYMTKRISEYIGVPATKAFVRRGGEEQKGLSTPERRLNAKKTLTLSNKAKISGKKVILFDDLVTTGSTMSRCVDLLFDGGARNVVTASIAKTARNGGKE